MDASTIAGAKSQKVVLVADDSAADFILLERAFRIAGYSHLLVHVPSGSAAMNYLRAATPYGDRSKFPFPNLVVIDDKMPGGSGMDVLKSARNEGYRVPIVMLSGSGLQGNIQSALELGAAEYLGKPFEVNELIVMAQTIHHRWLVDKSR